MVMFILYYLYSSTTIRFDAKRRMFYFKFDYNKFDTYVDMPKTSWTVWTNGERVKTEINNGYYNSKVVDITRQMQYGLAGIDYEDGHNLKEDLSRLNPKNVMNGRIINDVYDTFCLATNMRNRRAESENEDYDVTISPIMKEYKDNQERFFDTKHAGLIGNMSIPTSGDANDTYCIALKGLKEVFNVKQAWLADKKFDRELLKISHEDWFAFVQSQAFRVNM